MVGGMATRKTSVSLTDEAIAAANAAAGNSGMSVSSWLSKAAIEQAWREQALVAADQLYEEAVRVSGAPTTVDRQWVDETLAATVGHAESSTTAAA